jgi:hypothetical protein
MPDKTETWEIKLADSISGILFLGSRKNGRGPWLTFDQTPKPVRDYIMAEVVPGEAHNAVIHRSVAANLDDLQSLISGVGQDRFGQRRGNQATIWVEVEKPPPPRRPIPRGVPAIRTLQDLIDHFGADDVTRLNRAVYRGTDAGASISVQTPDGAWHDNGDDWSAITEIVAFKIQTIVEGSDYEVNMMDPFVLPVTVAAVNRWIEELEVEATRLWEEANQPEEPPPGVLDWRPT